MENLKLLKYFKLSSSATAAYLTNRKFVRMKKKLTHLNYATRINNMFQKLNSIIWLLILFASLASLETIEASCVFNGATYSENSNWLFECQNCTCTSSIPFCNQIQCKYEPCENGKVLILNNDMCCPKCQEPKLSCHYEGHLIQHNTEFSPKLCSTCKCKNGQIECSNNCVDEEQSSYDYSSPLVQLTSLNQRKSRLRLHHHNHKSRNNRIQMSKELFGESSLLPAENTLGGSGSGESVTEARSACVYDNNIYQFNTTWSPIKCSICKCSFNSIVECYTFECPVLDCPNGYEMKEDSCCPVCKPVYSCVVDDKFYKNGDYWTSENDPCTHCSCTNNQIKCFKENCTSQLCGKNEILVSKSNKCCPECESQMSDNCEYYGKMYYNGEMWYTKGCQHCACNFGKVICMNVQCESSFCLSGEILVKKKDECCLSCRKPKSCQIDQHLTINENEFWIPNNNSLVQQFQKPHNHSCKICECVNGHLDCYSNSCKNTKYPSYVHLFIYNVNEKKELNARTIPFFANIIKSMKKKSTVFVVSGPKYSNLFLNDKEIKQFTVSDLASSKVYYKPKKIKEKGNDFVVLSFVSSTTNARVAHNVLILFDYVNTNGNTKLRDNNSLESKELLNLIQSPFLSSLSKSSSENERNVRGFDMMKDMKNPPPRKTIFISPGEAIKLTSNELKPKNLDANVNPDRLIYFLVSGNPKYGELKLKKIFSNDEAAPAGWNQVNDIYLEKTVREFTQNDLDNGNVWYEPLNDLSSSSQSNTLTSGCNKTKSANGNDDDGCNEQLSAYFFSPSGQSDQKNGKYDHCMFEVYDQGDLNSLISKEILHFSIQNEIINETILGLEVIENQITPLTFSNFDIAGIDSTREYLIYRIIKNLEKNQGLLEHANSPGVPIETFSQNDLNKGLILYSSPKEIGVNPQEFLFTFIVTNDNRSDTFPETPFHIKVLPSNDQAPSFKETLSNLVILQGGSLILTRDLFDVNDPDTSIDNIIFTVVKPPDNIVIELRTRGQRYVISKDDSFTIQEIRDGTFRLIHNGATQDKDSLKISVSDNKHLAYKTINLKVQLLDKVAPSLGSKSAMLMSLREGEKKTLRRDNLAFVDDKSSSDEIFYKLTAIPNSKNLNANGKYIGKLFKKEVELKPTMMFTQADIDLQNIRYEAPQEIGPSILTESIYFDVSDKEGNVLHDQVFTIKIEPLNNQAPNVEVSNQPVKILEGSYLILNESLIRVSDIDSAKEQLNVVIDSQPNFGYLENIQKATQRISSFPYTDLINGLNIRYVQNDHKNKEPNTDMFIFHVSDGANESPTHKFMIDIKPVNDEMPIAMFENLMVEATPTNLNKRTLITNSTLFIVDFDTKPQDIVLNIEEFPKHGKLYLGNNELTNKNQKFSYLDVLNKELSFKFENKFSNDDEIKFKISDETFSFINTLKVKKYGLDKNIPSLERNEGLQAIAGQFYQINQKMLKAVKKYKSFFDYDSYESEDNQELFENFLYKIVSVPTIGKLQYRVMNNKRNRINYRDLTGINKFTQRDINQGHIFYYHSLEEPTGITEIRFNVSDSEANILADQRFIISVRGDKLPPVFIVNKGLKVNQSQSSLLTKAELDVRDDDTHFSNIKFFIVTQPKQGHIENTKEQGKRIDSFSYEDLSKNRIKYFHNDKTSVKPKNDIIDLRVTDGKNEATTNFFITILRNDNQLPIVKSTFTMRVKELSRKPISSNELKIIDRDTPSDQVKIIITNPPEYGTLEKMFYVNSDDLLNEKISKKIEDKLISINTSSNQKLNFILKFNNFSKLINSNSKNEKISQFMIVNEFTSAELDAGLIYYNHRSPGIKQDRFGFIVFDGFNSMFIIDEQTGQQASSSQVFNINIDTEKNQAPIIEKNLGLEYLYQIDGQPGRIIMKNELLAVDKDDSDLDLVYDVTRSPYFGSLEHKDHPMLPLLKFTQTDINQNKIYFILRHASDNQNLDSFEFDVCDSAKNCIRKNQFTIKWSVLNFEEQEVTVMENEGKARVHIKKNGNLKQFSMVTCKTISDSAKSNRDSKLYDFVHTQVRVELNEDESYKACDIIIHKDQLAEPIETFYVVLEDAKYSVIGSNKRIKINILDKKKETLIEFEKVKFDVHESDKFVSLPIIRSGDLNCEIQVECLTQEDYLATAGLDYVARNVKNQNYLVKIPAGEVYGFCDIEIIDDTLHEIQTESFKAVLVNPVSSISLSDIRLGPKNEAKISIIGPNDVPFQNCKTEQVTVSENVGKLSIDVTRENYDTSLAFEVVYTTVEATENDLKTYHNKKEINQPKSDSDKQQFGITNKEASSFSSPRYHNISKAIANQDYEYISQVVKFEAGEITKKIYINILNDVAYPVMEGIKLFTIVLKPILNEKNSKGNCNYINPDIVHVFIDDTIEEGISVGFNQTSLVINETNKVVKVPIIRHGDLSQAFSVICFTKQQTAIEDKDYVSRGTLEHSRIYFEPGDKIKWCPIEIINDSVYEADETFQVKLSDLRGSNNHYVSDLKFNQHTSMTVTILNDEDASVVSLAEEEFFTEEPSSSDSSIVKSITVIRTGDLSRLTTVRISTVDDTAIAGHDYKPKTETLKFQPGVSAIDFEIEILYDSLREQSESFKVVLGPQAPVSGVFGKIKSASVVIRDNNVAANNKKESSFEQQDNYDYNLLSKITSNHQEYNKISKLFSEPYLTSLITFLSNESLLSMHAVNNKSNQTMFATSREPLICLHACHFNHPSYKKNEKFCQAIKTLIDSSSNQEKLKILYAWEISTPNEYGYYSSYIKLTENSQFSLVNESVLESFYFQPYFHVRCTIQLRIVEVIDNEAQNIENLPTFKSNVVEILENDDEKIIDFLNTNKACSKFSKQDINYTTSETSQNAFFYYRKSKTQSNLPSLATFKFDKPFTAKADYISADFLTMNPQVDVKYLNYIRLTIEIPFVDGMIPLVSTMPLNNYKHLLSDPKYSTNHICSNFIESNNDSNDNNEQFSVKYGFLNEQEAASVQTSSSLNKTKLTMYNDLYKKYRNKKTLEFYSHLNIEKCTWRFTAYFAISELTTFCQAQIISDPDIREDYQTDKSYLTIKVPLHVSYLYASPQASWSSIEYKSFVDATIIYRTASILNDNQIIESDFIAGLAPINSAETDSGSFENIFDTSNRFKPNEIYLNSNKADLKQIISYKNENLLSLSVSKISMSQDGKFILEFSTVPSFHGQFVKYHPSLPNYESYIIGPADQNTDYNLELVWSQYTFDYPEQTWKATSNSFLNDYSGNYTVKLIPCYAKNSQSFKYPFDCEPKEPINFTIPIIIEQAFRPVSLKYSLGTKFLLSNNLIDTLNPLGNNFDGNFRKDDQLYGTIIWNDENHEDKKSEYKIQLEKIYVCSSSSQDFIPTYDPDGLIYNKGPQFGCAKPHKSLRHRIILLDRANHSASSNVKSGKIKYDAQFITEYLTNFTRNEGQNKLKNGASPTSAKTFQIMDGFKFNINSLFDLETYLRKSQSNNQTLTTNPNENLWYVQAMFIIRPIDSLKHHKSRMNRHLSSIINTYSLNKGVYNNGTNMQTFRLSNDQKKSVNLLSDIYYSNIRNKNTHQQLQEREKLINMNSRLRSKMNGHELSEMHQQHFKKLNKKTQYFKDAYLKLIIPLIVFIVLTMAALGSVAYFKKRSIEKFFIKDNESKSSSKRFPIPLLRSSASATSSNKNNTSSSLSSNETQNTLIVANHLSPNNPKTRMINNNFDKLRVMLREKINSSRSDKCNPKRKFTLMKNNKSKSLKSKNQVNTDTYSGTNSTSDTIMNSPLLIENESHAFIKKLQQTNNTSSSKANSMLILNNEETDLNTIRRNLKKSSQLHFETKIPTSNLDAIFTSLVNEVTSQNDYANDEEHMNRQNLFLKYQQDTSNQEISYDENIYKLDQNIENINSLTDEDSNLKSTLDKDIHKKNRDSTKKLNTFKQILQKIQSSNTSAPQTFGTNRSSKLRSKSSHSTNNDLNRNLKDTSSIDDSSAAQFLTNRQHEYEHSHQQQQHHDDDLDETLTNTNTNQKFPIQIPIINQSYSHHHSHHNHLNQTPASKSKSSMKYRNNYLYFNYNNNKMHYFNTETSGENLLNPMMTANYPNQHDTSVTNGFQSCGAQVADMMLFNESMVMLNGAGATTNVINTSYTPIMSEVMAMSMHSSTPNQTTPVSSSTKCSIAGVNTLGKLSKRHSGTEV